MASRCAKVSMLISVVLHLAIDKVDAKTWQVLAEACEETNKNYPECSMLENE